MKYGSILLLLSAIYCVDALSSSGQNVDWRRESRRKSYQTNCNFWGWSACTKYKTVYYKSYYCRTGYRSTDDYGCPHPICDNDIQGAACNINYQSSHIIYSDGSTQYKSGGYCSSPERCAGCNRGFYASPNRCRMCTAITNCDFEECTSSSDQKCSRCEGVVTEMKGHRAYFTSPDLRQCIQACSWRTDSTRCYPGTCDSEAATSCSCMEGFSDYQCQTIDTIPTILYNYLKMAGLDNSTIDLPDDPSMGSPQNETWTAMTEPETIKYQFKSKYIPPGQLPDRHEFIEDFKVGIIDGKTIFTFIRGGKVLNVTTRPCGGADVYSPEQAVYTCEDEIFVKDIAALPVISGDIIKVQFETTNGGYVTVKDKETHAVRNEIYQGQTLTNTYILGFDFIPPYHCLDVGNDIDNTTTNNSTDIAYGNNTDIAYGNMTDNNMTNGSVFYRNFTDGNITGEYMIDDSITVGNKGTGNMLDEEEEELELCPHKNMVNITAGSAKSPIPLNWDGWRDDVGVFTYEMSVYDLVDTNASDDNSLLVEKSFVQTHTAWDPTLTDNIVLSNPGAYALVFSAYDKAGNYKSARRIFVSDLESMVEPIPENEFVVTSAVDITDFLWQWNVESVSVAWDMRYINTLHHGNGWLKGVASIPDVEPLYDDNDFSRSINPVPNIQGVVEYQTGFLVDHLGGNNITEPPPDSEFESQNLTMNQTIAPELVDGDTLRFWIRAYDVRREYLEENRTLHIDTSPPIIEDLWITREDRLNLTVHSIEDFNKMTFEWICYDIHSGMEAVSWRLFDNFTGEDILHGTDRLSPQGEAMTLEDCEEKYGEYARGSNCYCTPGVGCFHQHYQVTPRVVLSNNTHGGVFLNRQRGVHDSDYFLEITVTNQAKLNTTLDFQLTIDASPAHTGVVNDGQYGEPEVDYQDPLHIHAHWEGFFDKESGVNFYQYQFTNYCLKAEDFGLDLESYNVTETELTHTTWEAEEAGRYYVTVVAYNSALEPSSPVCSDGVTVDRTPPAISHIAVDNSRVVPGLVSTPDRQIWFIDKQRRRAQVNNPNDLCRSKATSIENTQLQVFPLHKFYNLSLVTHISSICEDAQPYISSMFKTFYLSKQQHLYVNWTSADKESGIYDYEVGLMSDVSGEADIHPYTSTNHHPHYHNFHPALNTGEQFYIAVKAINKAGLETIQVLGPVIVHTQPPESTGETSVTLEGEHLVAEWEDGLFSDEAWEHLTYELAVGTEDEATFILPFSGLKSGGGCTLSSPSTCAAVPLTDLPWDLHHSHVYHVSIRVTNIVDLSTVALSQPYVHDVRLPSTGVVMEVCPFEERETFRITEYQESDYQLSSTSLLARWYGFDDGVLNVTYRVGIGSKKGKSNIVPLLEVGEDLEYTFEDIHMTPLKKYFITVEASSLSGSSTVSSDGVYILRNLLMVNNVAVWDGLGCYNDTNDWTHDYYENQSPMTCDKDLEFQKSTSMISAHWNRSLELTNQYPDVYWRLEKKLPNTEDIWDSDMEFTPVGKEDYIVATGLFLEAGHTFRVCFRFCAATVCTRPLHSDGVTILHSPPVGGKMSVGYANTAEGSELDVRMTRLYDPDVPVLEEAYAVVDRYEWCLTDDSHSSRALTKWTPVRSKWLFHNKDETTMRIWLPEPLDFSKCRRLAVRGYNKLGLYTVISADVKNCSAIDPQLVTPKIVIDAIGERDSDDKMLSIDLDLNEWWSQSDVDYTPYTNMLSAVWPTLRHRNYTWAVVSGDKVDPTSHYKRENLLTVSDPCALPDVIKCGHTENEFVNVDMVDQLHHGSRYYICIHAHAKRVKNEKWTQRLEEMNACSDGVTVDLTPPEGGRVFIGGLAGNKIQVSKSEMEVYWDSFVDVEESGTSPHLSGISHYEVSLGSFAGGRDLGHEDVGLVNHFTFHHLNLHDGYVVYVSVKAIDHVLISRSVISDGILIDSTAPSPTGKQIEVSERYIISPLFQVCWNGLLVDVESGIGAYEVSVGSRPAYADIMTVTPTDDCFSVNATGHTVDGHSLFVSVTGFNNAGLHTLVTSRPLVVDRSPPSIGHVYDGLYMVSEDRKDKDFVTRISDMGAHWEGFSDPHSSISHYLVKVGICPGCGDTVAEYNVGARTDIAFTNVVFVHGVEYYVEVTGCNMAGLCSVGRSDGVILDVTPPVAGVLQDGTSDNDIQFQASRYFLGCKWRGFSDAESGLDHYEWRVGTVPAGEDILPARNVALEEVTFHSFVNTSQLPVGKRLYATVAAFNRAGMKTEVSSNGFLVDDTAPVVMTEPRHVNDLSTASTAFSRTTLKVAWHIKDDDSFIERQYISISSHQLGEFNSSLIEVPGPLQEYTFTQLDLHDGSLYKVKITGCNMAGLCTSSSTEEILLDSSPPTIGSLAVETEHAARLSRHLTGWMTWTHTSLSLAWLGFADLHSGIQHYIVTVGSGQFLSDLNEDESVKLYHNQNGTEHEDEGSLQTYNIKTKDISSRDSVFVAMWAVNGVGLESKALHHELTLVPGGVLELVRRCKHYNCHGSCVCAVQDGTCSLSEGCSQQDGGIVMVTDVTGLHLSTGQDEDFSCFNTYMAAEWAPSESVQSIIKYYEVSIGDEDAGAPEGYFDENIERIWFDVGQRTVATMPFIKERELNKGHTYSFFVRTWYNDSCYSISKSDGVTIDIIRPQITTIQGFKVKEVSERSADRDVDFQTSRDRVILTWNNTFLPGQTGLLRYVVYISTSTLGHSIHTSGDLTSTSYTAEGLSLEPNTVYYTSVLAYDKAGLVSWAYSDGVQVDVEPPVSGIVYDGQGSHNIDYQSSSKTVSASWHGFFDADSSIVKYHWCVGVTDDATDCSVLDWQDVGLHLQAVHDVSPIETGKRVWSKVYAEDVVGHKSEVVLSDGLVIDTSPPEPQNIIYLGENLIQNPSFEDSIVHDIGSNCTSKPSSWEIIGTSCANVVISTTLVAKDDTSHIVLGGSVRQNISGLIPGQMYSVVIYTGYPDSVNAEDKFIEGFVSVDNKKFSLKHDPHRCKGVCNLETHDVILWNTFKFSYIATKDTSVLEIGTSNREMELAVDLVSLHRVNYDDQDTAGSVSRDHLEVHSVFHHHWSALHVVWHFKEEQSPITEYKWAVGLSRGGDQIQGFKSVGTDTTARVTGLKLIHGSKVFVTIMATNAAGLSTLSYSKPIVVDMTPPVILHVNDGLGADVNFITQDAMSVNWKVSDQETDVAYCDWAVGLSRGHDDLKEFERVPLGQFFAKGNISDLNVTSHVKAFSTIRCFNQGGLASMATSDGAVLVTDDEDISDVGLDILETQSAVFSNAGTCNYNPELLKLKWPSTGSSDLHPTSVYVDNGETIDDSSVPKLFPLTSCELIGLPLVPGMDYNISIRHLDYLQQPGEALSQTIQQRSKMPTVKDNTTIEITSLSEGEITLEWTDLFTSPWPELTYEVDVGTVLGGADIVETHLTMATNMTLTLTSAHRTKEIFVSVTAIDSCGDSGHFSQNFKL